MKEIAKPVKNTNSYVDEKARDIINYLDDNDMEFHNKLVRLLNMMQSQIEQLAQEAKDIRMRLIPLERLQT